MSTTDSSSTPNPTTLLQSFRALAISEGITNRKSKAYKQRRREFLVENVQDIFITQFGVDAANLNNWKRLLATIGIEGSNEFTSIKECKEVSRSTVYDSRKSLSWMLIDSTGTQALKGKYINIVDLVDAGNAGKTITKPNPFPSAKALARYIQRTGKAFPKNKAKANPLLAQFLIVVTGRGRR
ncbi:hypothetical protein PM082_013909 [Marasmius tenuissimus]|nr:hypothetical protein PM082_013909 [Marasmius tenuissimus]